MEIAITAVLAALISGLVTVVVTKMTLKKRQPLLEAQVAKISVETLTKVLETQKQENKEVSNQLKAVKNELSKFRKAMEKIGTCPHAADCPVACELQNGEKKHRNADTNNE